MKYVIVYLIKGEAEEYHQKLIKEVGPKFGENYVVENPLPSHVTLKSPFETDKIEEVEEILSEFVKTQNPHDIELEGFDNFNNFVAFLKTDFSKEATHIQNNLIDSLKKLKWIKLHEHDTKWHPHVTISYGNTEESFNQIWNYLKTLETPKFNLKFDNITLLRKPKEHWEIYKEFEIK